MASSVTPLQQVEELLKPLLDTSGFGTTVRRHVMASCAVEAQVLRWSLTLDGSVAKGRADFRGKGASAQDVFGKEVEAARALVRERFTTAVSKLKDASRNLPLDVNPAPLVDTKTFVAASIEVRLR